MIATSFNFSTAPLDCAAPPLGFSSSWQNGRTRLHEGTSPFVTGLYFQDMPLGGIGLPRDFPSNTPSRGKGGLLSAVAENHALASSAVFLYRQYEMAA